MPRTSNKAQLIVDYVNQFIQENGYSPSVREIGAAVGLRSTASVSYHLQALQERVCWFPLEARAASVPWLPAPGPVRFPLLVWLLPVCPFWRWKTRRVLCPGMILAVSRCGFGAIV